MLPYNLSPERLIANFNNNQTAENALKMQEALKKATYYVFASSRHARNGQPAAAIFNLPDGALLEVCTSKEGAEKRLSSIRSQAGDEAADTLLTLNTDGLRQLLEQIHLPAAMITINPENSPITFSFANFLQFTAPDKAAPKNGQEYTIEPGQTLTFTQAAGTLKTDTLRQLDQLAGNLGYVSRVWIADTKIEGRKTRMYIFETDFPLEDMHPLAEAAAAVHSHSHNKSSLMVMDAREDAAKDVAANMQPAFKRH